MPPFLTSTREWITAGLRAGILRRRRWSAVPVFFGRCLAHVPDHSLVFFPVRNTCFGCGIAGIVVFKRPAAAATPVELPALERMAEQVQAAGFRAVKSPDGCPGADYLGGDAVLESLWQAVQALKRRAAFATVFADPGLQSGLERLAAALGRAAAAEGLSLAERIGRLPAADADRIAARVERLRDIAWALQSELLDNLRKVRALLAGSDRPPEAQTVQVFRDLNAAATPPVSRSCSYCRRGLTSA